ncbi:MAG: hypothetical protein IJV41_10615 [Oscillospiraceae bacterium]|nr:hypothetical protein [Oscillospiraceae bacterium]
MATPAFNPDKVLGNKLAQMDKQELCSFVSNLCRTVVSEVGSRGRRGGIYPENISVDENGAVAVGPAGKAPWAGQELDFVAPELYWNGQLSAASDVYSVGMLMYYAVGGGKLPLEGECSDPQLRRMGGGNPSAPKSAGRRLGTIIEKSIRFKASERYQTLEELRAVVDSCVKDLYLSGVPSAEAIFKKNDDDLDDVERMMVGIIEKGEDEAIETADDYPTEEPEDGVKVYNPSQKTGQKELFTAEQSDMLVKKLKSTSSPAVPKLEKEDDPALQPVTIAQNAARSSPAVQYKMKTDRERKIAEEVKKRRRRPLAVILVLCAVLVMVAIIMNAMLKDFEEARNRPDNLLEPVGAAATPEPETDESGYPIKLEDFNTSTPGPSVTMEPVEAVVAQEHYQVFQEDISWTGAARKCADLGGHLVVIDDDDEFDEVVALAEEAGISRVWIGCHRINGEYVWEAGEGIYRWAQGEPTYVDTNDQVAEDYIMLWNNRGWAYNDNRDDPCRDYPAFYSGTMGYICEFD